MNSIINRLKMDVGQAKDVENALAEADNNKAFQDYIICCDHPELLEDDEEGGMIDAYCLCYG